tara:strand:- start:471 stop:746 length:276 start_codon:yes stop_codon:yes gene_type:complete
MDPNLRGGVYTLCDGEVLSLPSICQRLAQGLQKPLTLFAAPRTILSVLPGGASITKSLVVDDSKFRADFNWHPPFTVQEGFLETTNWFKKA